MFVSPISENQASEEVKKEYKKLKEALNTEYLPLFFTYIGGFPEYLNYLTDQLVPNLKNTKFIVLIQEAKKSTFSLIESSLSKNEEIGEWLGRYKNSPSFYNFQKDLDKIFTVNLKSVFIFVALREALKGWAIAAKKLSTSNLSRDEVVSSNQKAKDFIYEEPSLQVININQRHFANQQISESGKIEKDLLPRYIFLCQQEYNQLMKTEKYLILRVGIEKLIHSSLTLLPEKIISPINIFYKLTEKYEEFPELLYLMYEYFPTYAVQKMMFSGFMKE